GLVIRLR
ncbi:hypothetical protein D039_4957B, partial [Vibrio parahaemolyticus EKP-028]